MQAIDFEKQLKGWSRAKKEALFREDWDLISELAKKKKIVFNPTHPSTGSG
jgi:predicted GIY-YIG superfamily endonuclease